MVKEGYFPVGTITNEIFKGGVHAALPSQAPYETVQTIPGERGAIRISVTPQCNLDCSYCDGEGQQHPNEWRGSGIEMPLQTVQAIIMAGYRAGSRWIRFTGGEPGVYTQLPELLDWISESQDQMPNIIQWGVNTNGLPFMQGERFDLLAASSLNAVVVGVDTLEAGENTKNQSTIGVRSELFLKRFLHPLAEVFRQSPGRILELDTVYTGSKPAVYSVVDTAVDLGITAKVLEVSTLHGGREGMSMDRKNFIKLLEEMKDRYGFDCFYGPYNLLYFFTPGEEEKPSVVAFQDRCKDTDCGNCRASNMRVQMTLTGDVVAAECYRQSKTMYKLLSPGEPAQLVTPDVLLEAARYSDMGPSWPEHVDSNMLYIPKKRSSFPITLQV